MSLVKNLYHFFPQPLTLLPLRYACGRRDKAGVGDTTQDCVTSIFRAQRTMGPHTELIILDREVIFFFIVYKYRRPEVDYLRQHLEQVRHGMRSPADSF
jgi:hypothetical protein